MKGWLLPGQLKTRDTTGNQGSLSRARKTTGSPHRVGEMGKKPGTVFYLRRGLRARGRQGRTKVTLDLACSIQKRIGSRGGGSGYSRAGRLPSLETGYVYKLGKKGVRGF